MEKLGKVDTRLSYSSATLLKNCTQKYYHYKVAGTPKDIDAEVNFDAFNVGKAFHWVLEQSGHTDKGLMHFLDLACKEFDVLNKGPMIHAMLLKYLKLHQEVGLKCIQTEFELSDDKFIGFIDAILADGEGNWWIADLKTAARINDLTVKRLHNDYQLNLYAFFVETIADHLQIDVKKFQGVRYRVTAKSLLKQRSTEDYKQYVVRMYNGIQSQDIAIRKEYLNTKEAMKGHNLLHDYSLMLRSGEVTPTRNYGYCDSFFKPCEYWSKCHGSLYTTENTKLEVFKK